MDQDKKLSKGSMQSIPKRLLAFNDADDKGSSLRNRKKRMN